MEHLENFFLWKFLVRTMQILVAVISFSIVLAITAAVIFRYVFKTDLFGLEEVEMLLAMWIYFIGAAYGGYRREQISADIMNMLLKSKRAKRYLRLFISTVSLLVSIFFAKWSLDYFELITLVGGTTTGLGIPLVAQRIPLVIGFILMVIFNAYHFICDLLGREPVLLNEGEVTASEEGKV